MTRSVVRKAFPTTKSQYHLGEAIDAVEVLEKQGVYLPPKPQFVNPALPEDVTDLSDSELMMMFKKVNDWAEYQGVQLAAAAVSEKFADDDLSKYRALSAMANKDEKTVTAAKAKAYVEDEFQTVFNRQHEAYSYRKIMESIYDNTERRSAFLSREITRRIGRNDREGRGQRWQ
jgi:hypothetical protein